MPHRFPFTSSTHGSDDGVQELVEEPGPKPPRRESLLKNLGGLWRRNHAEQQREVADASFPLSAPSEEYHFQPRRSSLPQDFGNVITRRVVPSLPRPQTFRRQESERRERLLEVPPTSTERRAVSVDRRRGLSASAARRPLSPRPVPLPSVSAPDIVKTDQDQAFPTSNDEPIDENTKPTRNLPDLPPLQIPDHIQDDAEITPDQEAAYQATLQAEYDTRWILNLSMHFRDKSNREKFFVTYAETPTTWRRLTISLDYRNAPPGSLEADLSTLHYQRDKALRIYESIRDSLPEIQYYPTVTNLKLETTPADGQLHVHVREDLNETITYPSTTLFAHIPCPRYREHDLEFLSHLSGFVYKVRTAAGATVIKKEIPGPDTVEEFLYEVNALSSLQGSRSVIPLLGLVTDPTDTCVKGLLIAYASGGALVDKLFDEGPALSWPRREKWARQIVEGLAAIHEAGYVQGDFTLSNIVLTADDEAVIIDINRRGCPVGWEPPELGVLIDSGQRIGMCIGVKTDLFQLGMVLWALAEGHDEPERVERPLRPLCDEVPYYYRTMVSSCLDPRPQGRSSAKALLRRFPRSVGGEGPRRQDLTVEFLASSVDDASSTHRSDKEYIDPAMAVTLEDVRHPRRPRSFEPPPASTTYRHGSSGSWIGGQKGRSLVSSRWRRSSPFARSEVSSSATSFSGGSPGRRSGRRWGSGSSVAVAEGEGKDEGWAAGGGGFVHQDSGFGEGGGEREEGGMGVGWEDLGEDVVVPLDGALEKAEEVEKESQIREVISPAQESGNLDESYVPLPAPSAMKSTPETGLASPVADHPLPPSPKSVARELEHGNPNVQVTLPPPLSAVVGELKEDAMQGPLG